MWKSKFLQNLIFILCVFLFQMVERWENQGSPQTSLSAPAMPQNIPYPPTLHRSSFPDSTEAFDPRKPDPYELYEKSRAIYESRRKWKPCSPCWPFNILSFCLWMCDCWHNIPSFSFVINVTIIPVNRGHCKLFKNSKLTYFTRSCLDSDVWLS